MVLFFSLLLLFALTDNAFAHHQQRVLGDSTTSNPQIPPTTDGPGLILPDSPLFFLDQLKQNTRLLFAFSPEDKARIHSAVAGERLAELRFMLAKNNKSGIDTALKGVSENLQKAADETTTAQLSGRPVSSLAKTINTNIKQKQESLDVLERGENRELRFKVKAVQEALLNAKVKVEDALPEQELENEVEDDLHRMVEDEVENASASGKRMEHAIDVLTNLASEAARKQQIRREEALRHAIEVKNETLIRIQQKTLNKEKKSGSSGSESGSKSGED